MEVSVALGWTLTGNTTLCDITGVVARASLRPSGAKRVKFTVNAGGALAEGAETVITPQALRLALSTAVAAAPVSNNFTDIVGTAKTIFITKARTVPTRVTADDSEFHIEVEGTIWTNE